MVRAVDTLAEKQSCFYCCHFVEVTLRSILFIQNLQLICIFDFIFCQNLSLCGSYLSSSAMVATNLSSALSTFFLLSLDSILTFTLFKKVSFAVPSLTFFH